MGQIIEVKQVFTPGIDHDIAKLITESDSRHICQCDDELILVSHYHQDLSQSQFPFMVHHEINRRVLQVCFGSVSWIWTTHNDK